MKQFFVFLIFITLSFALKAQTAADSVKKVIATLFDGMKNSDTALLISAFADSAILQTITKNKAGNLVVENETVKKFAAMISTIPKGDADEQVVYDVVKIDGPLAMVWAPYKFYYKGIFSHCGINSFQLIKVNGQWKIQYLIDTRRKNNCE